MALARMCMKNSSFCPLPNIQRSFRGMQGFEARRPRSLISCSYSSSSSNSSEKAGDNQVAVQATSSPADTSRGSRRRGLLWRNPLSFLPFRFRNNAPAISDLRSLANALVQLPSSLKYKLLGHRVKEDDKCYRLRFEVPGLSKDDLKITVEEDRFLVITGERKEEEDEDGGDDGWYSQMCGWFSTSVPLPDDAKVDGIKAEVRDGLLCVTVPRDEDKKKRNVYEVEIQ